MKILHITSWGFRPEFRGFSPEFHLAKTQSDLGHRVAALTFRDTKGDDMQIEDYGELRIMKLPYFMRERYIGGRRCLYPSPVGVSRYLHCLSALSSDITHLHFSVSSLSLLASMWPRKTQATVITNHDPFIASGLQELHSSLSSMAKQMLVKRQLVQSLRGYVSAIPFKSVDRIVVFTGFEKNLMISQGIPAGKFHIIPNGVNFERLNRVEPGFFKRLGIPKPVVLSIGRFTPQKGQAHLIMAAGAIREKIDAHFVFIGHGLGGGNEPELRRLARERGVSNHVHFLANVSDEDVSASLHDCDVFAFPSLFESFGIALVEALAVGKPVVAYRASGIPEILGKGKFGLLVKTGDISALAEGIINILETTDSNTLQSQAARQWARSTFDWSRVAKMTLEMYSGLLERARERNT